MIVIVDKVETPRLIIIGDTFSELRIYAARCLIIFNLLSHTRGNKLNIDFLMIFFSRKYFTIPYFSSIFLSVTQRGV